MNLKQQADGFSSIVKFQGLTSANYFEMDSYDIMHYVNE